MPRAGTASVPSKSFAKTFFITLAQADTSVESLIKLHGWPNRSKLQQWRDKFPWFKHGWDNAKQLQAEFLAQKCLDLAHHITPKTAHVARVQFDIFRWVAAKFSPDKFGDKPSTNPSTGSVHVQVNLVSPERVADLRHRLNLVRNQPQTPLLAQNPVLPLSVPASVPSRETKSQNGAQSGSGTGTGSSTKPKPNGLSNDSITGPKK